MSRLNTANEYTHILSIIIMKKILLFAAALACSVASWAADVVTASVAGQTIDVALQNDTKFCAFQMDITLPAGVSVTNVELNVARLDEGTTTVAGAANGNFQIAYNVLSDNKLRVIAYNLANREIAQAEGTLFTVTLGDEVEAANVSLSNVLFVDKDNLAEHTITDATVVEGTDILIGDANGDGDVDVFDLFAVLDYADEIITEEDGFVFKAADVDNSGEIDIFDFMAIVDIINAE